MISISYQHVKEWEISDIVELYKAGSWWKDEYDPSGIHALIAGSFDFVIAFDEDLGKAVGMGRMISDGVSDAYIQDVVVLNDRRGEGIGAKITKELISRGKEAGLVWIGLIAEKGTEGFYKDLGFKRFEGDPMLYSEEER
jgi:ribosomal protein S18 acetylase RimI-like enzyme